MSISPLRFTFGAAIPTIGLAVIDSLQSDKGPVAYVYQRKGRRKNVIVATQLGDGVPEVVALNGEAYRVGGDALDALNAKAAELAKPLATPSVTLDLVRQRWERESKPPHARKIFEVAVLLRAATKEDAAQELEALAHRVRGAGRDGMIGYVGHSVGFHATTAYAGIDLSEAPVTLPSTSHDHP